MKNLSEETFITLFAIFMATLLLLIVFSPSTRNFDQLEKDVAIIKTVVIMNAKEKQKDAWDGL